MFLLQYVSVVQKGGDAVQKHGVYAFVKSLGGIAAVQESKISFALLPMLHVLFLKKPLI